MPPPAPPTRRPAPRPPRFPLHNRPERVKDPQNAHRSAVLLASPSEPDRDPQRRRQGGPASPEAAVAYVAEVKVCEPVSAPRSLVEELQALRAEVQQLRQENERLQRELDQAKADLGRHGHRPAPDHIDQTLDAPCHPLALTVAAPSARSGLPLSSRPSSR